MSYDALLEGRCRDPHAILGVHATVGDDPPGLVVRAYRPDATALSLVVDGEALVMDRVHDGGVFARVLPDRTFPLSYELEVVDEHGRLSLVADPYRFAPVLGDLDLYLSGEGSHLRLYDKLGAHPRELDGFAGTSFAVWAPNAVAVSVVGSFNEWDPRLHPMRAMGESGIWELFVPGVRVGELYKYALRLADGAVRVKTDPLAFQMELRPDTASVVAGLGDFAWGDQAWLAARAEHDIRKRPVAIYEVHLGSWMRSPDHPDRFLSYRDLAPKLVAHAVANGFTHVELLPVAEHAYDPSWGYQVTGYFAPTSRFGAPDDLRWFVDHCHQNGVGVIIDWVPAHFPRDDFALRRFDGTALYEHDDPRRGEHRDWGTLIFNYGRNEVRAFLLSNALYWLDEFHIDGLRVDAVASMLYLDYSREDGEWLPNRYGGRENLDAIALLRQMNDAIAERCPGAFTIAEESTAWPGVTMPTHLGGLGFTFKWNMGWMHDTLRYLAADPVYRKHEHNDITFSMLYAYSESFMLPLSHDEVVHLKGSLFGKMPGDDWQKAANLRLLLSYQFAHPGKKLLFMGGEFGQRAEWNQDVSLDWHLLDDPLHAGVQRMVADLGALYGARDALWAWDDEPRGFAWIDCHDQEQSVISFARRGPSGVIVCVFNFTPVVRADYRIGLPAGGTFRELLNTDAGVYGGGDVGNGGMVEAEAVPFHDLDHSAALTLPPLGAVFLSPIDPSADLG